MNYWKWHLIAGKPISLWWETKYYVKLRRFVSQIKMFINPGVYLPFQTRNGIASINKKVDHWTAGGIFSDNLSSGMQTQLVVFILHASSPSLDSNCACWTSEQPYQIMPKLSLGSAVNIAPGEKGLKKLSRRNSKYTELSIIEQGRCYKRDIITKSSYLRLNRTNSSKAPWFS